MRLSDVIYQCLSVSGVDLATGSGSASRGSLQVSGGEVFRSGAGGDAHRTPSMALKGQCRRRWICLFSDRSRFVMLLFMHL